MNPKELGQYGEQWACDWLEKQGFKICERNYREGRLEVDIIANKKSFLYFIEVKTRRNTTYGFPEEQVSSRQIENLKTIAEKYPLEQGTEPRFAIVSILFNIKTKQKIIHFFDDIY